MTRVKICGITRLEDAQHAAACGAEMLGFNFYAKSPRYISPEAARAITASLPSNIETVGVFVNEISPTEVRQIANLAGVKSVQLHGDEGLEYCAALSDLNVIKALRVDERFDFAQLARYTGCRILLDSASPAFGGSGTKFDWQIAQRVRQHVASLILAGGLHGDSVGEAIRQVMPDAVDACSLLESAPGIKDSAKVERFIAAAHAEEIHSATQSTR
jgi:phosphoribosylanthranilate isomerase